MCPVLYNLRDNKPIKNKAQCLQTSIWLTTKTNGLIIGRNAQNLRELENVVNRYFKIKEIKVV